MKREIYKKLAHVLAEIGVRLQPGETVIIQAEPEEYMLVREITAVCYQLGARYVKIDFTDSEISRIRGGYSDKEYLDSCPRWLYEYRKSCGEDNICVISLHSPGLFAGMETEGMRRVRQSEDQSDEGFRQAAASGKVSIVKTSIPNRQWAEIVYPDMERGKALEKLWADYIHICRLDEENPVAAWRAHQSRIMDKKNKLNRLELTKLYLLSPDTNLEVGLVSGGKWIGGCAVNQKNRLAYVPNIPTEEIFFVPDKYRVNGRVVSTVPLNYRGSLIEGMDFEVREGRVTAFTAQKGEALLASILGTDSGSCYFGEIALVSVQSPIYQLHTVFYDTLLDENAACHIALGNGTPGIIEGGYTLDERQRDEAGINSSRIHVDFMIGSPEMDVDGLAGDGKRVAIMRQGDWVI